MPRVKYSNWACYEVIIVRTKPCPPRVQFAMNLLSINWTLVNVLKMLSSYKVHAWRVLFGKHMFGVRNFPGSLKKWPLPQRNVSAPLPFDDACGNDVMERSPGVQWKGVQEGRDIALLFRAFNPNWNQRRYFWEVASVMIHGLVTTFRLCTVFSRFS